MKILLDSCVWGGAREALCAAGHDVEWAGDWPADPGDDAILAYAWQTGRVLVTLDKDFGELAVVRGAKHVGIIRLVNLAAQLQGPHAALAAERYQGALSDGAIVTVSPTRVRIRSGPRAG
jgi:predicted nuclease of predicted toxin-antitoxin system